MILIYLLIMLLFTYLSYKKPLASVSILLILISIMYSFADNSHYLSKAQAIYLEMITTITFFSSLIAILISKKVSSSTQWAKIIAKWTLILALTIIFQTLVFIIFGFWGCVSLFFILLVASSYISIKFSAKYSKPLCVLSTISSGINQNLPLTVVLDSAAQNSTNKLSRIFREMKNWLIQGRPLSESFKFAYSRCPGHMPAMISAAEKINQIPRAIEMLLFDTIKKAKEKIAPKFFAPSYPIIVLLIAFIILLFIMKFIMPQFVLILNELCNGETLPKISIVVFKISSVIAYELWWQITLVILVSIPICIYIKFRPRRPEKPLLFSKIGDFIKWHLPVINWFEKHNSLLRTVEYLRLSLNVDSRIDHAIEGACQLDINICFKKRLKSWLKRIRSGENIPGSARKERLGKLLPWALSGNNVPANLEMIEEVIRSNYSYRKSLVSIITEPITVIVLAAIVCSIVLAIFLPMVDIVNSLADQVTPF